MQILRHWNWFLKSIPLRGLLKFLQASKNSDTVTATTTTTSTTSTSTSTSATASTISASDTAITAATPRAIAHASPNAHPGEPCLLNSEHSGSVQHVVP